MVESIKSVLMARDGISSENADAIIRDARIELDERLHAGENCDDFCAEEFGLEPDYLFELLMG